MARRKIRYRQVSEMCDRVSASLGMLPPDLDMVVGIPRSGMIAATLITLYRNLPMTDMEGLFEGRMIKSGHRSIEQMNSDGRRCKALVIDDSVGSGSQMRAARERLKVLEDRFEFVFAAVYVTETGRELVDVAMEMCPTPRCFQWNVMNHPYMAHACVDVLALLQPSVSERVMASQKLCDLWDQIPLFKPKYKLASLVVPAEAAERQQVEQWMQQHGLSCERIVFGGRDWAGYGKARHAAQHDLSLLMAYVYSRHDARRAASVAGLPTLSADCFELIQPTAMGSARHQLRRLPAALHKRLCGKNKPSASSNETAAIQASAE